MPTNRLRILGEELSGRSPEAPIFAGEEAEKLEKMLGVKVMRHEFKKPEGKADELEAHFG